MNEQPLIKSSAAGVVSLPAETQFAGNGIVSRTILRTPVSRVVLFGFAEGQELTEHSSTYEALVQILSGECEFVLDGNVHHVKAGDLVFMPPGLPHSLKATSQFSMLLTLSKPGSTPSKKEQPKKAAVALA
jgi:quercetin dioxygenase-like cupin family protein